MESIPDNLTYANGSLPHPSTYTGISQLLDKAQGTIEIASFYWSMRPGDLPSPDGSSWQVGIYNKSRTQSGPKPGYVATEDTTTKTWLCSHRRYHYIQPVISTPIVDLLMIMAGLLAKPIKPVKTYNFIVKLVKTYITFILPKNG